MNSVFNIGPFSIHLYSICLMLAVITGYTIIVKEAKNKGYNEESISNMMFYAILFGILGARIYYCIFNLDYYLSNPTNILKVWEGGLAIHGGIIGGALTIYFYTKKRKHNLLEILDIVVLGVIIGQAIGRWGNFFNGEAHGPITTLTHLKSMFLPNFIIKGMYIDGNYYIPTFLYESLWCFLGFIIMYLLKNKNLKTGFLTGFYFVWYGVERLYIEFLRTDSLMLFNIKIAQIISIIMIILGICILIRGNKND